MTESSTIGASAELSLPDLNGSARSGAHGRLMEKTIAQTHAEWITHGNIARLRYALDLEKDVGRRTWLAGLLQEQLILAAPAV